MARLNRGLNAFGVGDTFIHPVHGKMAVSKVVGFQEGMTFGKELKVVGLWVVMAVRDGKKRAEKVSFQVPDPAMFAKPPALEGGAMGVPRHCCKSVMGGHHDKTCRNYRGKKWRTAFAPEADKEAVSR